MKEELPSQTALLMAAYRARATQTISNLCNDPWAKVLSGSEGEALAKEFDKHRPHLVLWTAIRTASIDAHVRFWTTPARPIEQVVLLGAGFDARAERLKAPGRKFFEVDHPATQKEKRRRLEAAKYPTDVATYVSCNFESEDFLDRLALAGFDQTAPALIIWEGVVPYLTEQAIRQTLRRVATGCHPQTKLVFDHLMKNVAPGAGRPAEDGVALSFIAGLGEEILFGTNDSLPMLYEEGFHHVRSSSFDELTLSLTGTYERDRKFRFQRLVLASVTPTDLP